jgi:predicted  nucleic acid-binding Zn-ribbon protein
MFRRVGERLIATYDTNKFYALNTIVIITKREKVVESLKYLLALFNSRLLNHYYLKFLKSSKKVFSEIQARQVAQLPVHLINFSDQTDKAQHDHIVKFVEQMLEAKEKLSKAKTEAEVNRLEMQCESLDRQIDEVVYGLYGLTEEEIKIVEGK